MTDIEPLIRDLVASPALTTLVLKTKRLTIFVPSPRCKKGCVWHPSLVADTERDLPHTLRELQGVCHERDEIVVACVVTLIPIADLADAELSPDVLELIAPEPASTQMLLFHIVRNNPVVCYHITEAGEIHRNTLADDNIHTQLQALITP